MMSTKEFVEKVIYDGPNTDKIAVINLQGMIEDGTAAHVIEQLEFARKDKYVRGIILRVNSPGGTISATDRIYHHLLVFQQDTELPAVAFMQGLAASGGYYASVACPQIIAEPTTLTGSIGVIMANFVVQRILKSPSVHIWPRNSFVLKNLISGFSDLDFSLYFLGRVEHYTVKQKILNLKKLSFYSC